MRRFEKWLPSLILVAVLLVSMVGGAVYAKYVTDKTLNGDVTITANLGTIELKEHQAVRQPNGSYTLNENEVLQNNYVLLPGLDIPKDPFVRITNKSPIEVYVYVEVVSKQDGSALTYEIDANNWLKISDSGKNNGKVYVYTGGTGVAKVVTENMPETYILKDNKVIVGQKLNSLTTSNLGLIFYASMYQVASGANAETVYTNNITA